MNKQELEIEETEENFVYETEIIKDRKISTRAWEPSINELYHRFLDGDLILQPEFQRYYVWDDKKASRLVESVLLKVPLPIIYLSEEDDGKLVVIDGQQRLISLFRFFAPLSIGNQQISQLRLTGLTVITELKRKTFSELPKDLQRHYKNYPLKVIVIEKESHPDVKFEIFERLNTGAVKLNDQELRNCIYRGRYNDLLKRLSQNKDFLFLLGLREPDKRMRDRELILRFFAFYHNTYLNYKPPMKRFLNREMEKHRNLDESEERELIEVFKKCVELTKIVFGEYAFRRFVIGDEKDPNGRWEKKVNKALFDVVMYGFSRYEKRQIIPHADRIREALIWLMTHNNDFLDCILYTTDKKEKVEKRFKIWLETLEKIVGLPVTEPRAFSSFYKKQLWESNPYCAICGQEIKILDDAEVDHIEEYIFGGKTLPTNARLVHRYCNRARRR